ncbi:MAG: hypothetical protein Kow00127_07140 [Bacteroidales bacterium]
MSAVSSKTSGQSFLQLEYGLTLPSGSFADITDSPGAGHARPGLSLKAAFSTVVKDRLSATVSWRYGFNQADYPRAGYRYAEHYSLLESGKYQLHFLNGGLAYSFFKTCQWQTSVSISGGWLFYRWPAVYSNEYNEFTLVSSELVKKSGKGQSPAGSIDFTSAYKVSRTIDLLMSAEWFRAFYSENKTRLTPNLVSINIGLRFSLSNVQPVNNQ